MSDEKIYQVALSMVPGIGDVTAKTLISYCSTAKDIFRKNKNQLSNIPGIGQFIADKILGFKNFAAAEAEIEKCLSLGIEILFFTDANYPKKLKHAPDSPSVLFYKGQANLNNAKTVSIVGTRKSTSYGREFTESIVEKLAKHQALIVSGLAYGIDIIAHRAALKHGLSTVGVMASGIDTIYPSMHHATAMQW